MSRHRIVRSMNLEEEIYDDDDELYSRSVEDSYCISPSTAAQFTWNRDRDRNVDFAAFMGREDVLHEEDELEEEEEEWQSLGQGGLNDSATQTRLKLNDVDRAKLNSCLEEVRNIIGEHVPESIMEEVIVRNKFNLESSLNELLSQQEKPKPKREPRQNRRNRQVPTVQQQTTAPNPTTAPVPEPSASSAANQDSLAEAPGVQVVTPSKPAPKSFKGVQAKGRGPASPDRRKAKGQGSEARADADLSRNSSPAKHRQEPRPEGLSTKAGDPMAAMDTSLRTAVESMGLEGDREVIQASVEAARMASPAASTPKAKSKAAKIDVMAEYAKRNGNKELLNLVVIGHVDAGKSTLMGHLLYQLGSVNKKTMHKYEQESKKLGKSSFAFAWVLDETEEERSRGVTMDVAQTRFETAKKSVTLLDAPGHKDFIPNMITGASQADVAILVINSSTGEFETGFDAGGQTREHALLARSLGVGQIIVAVNKMDTVDWSQERYQVITKKIGQFLNKQAGFRDSDVSFVPCSGLSGQNLVSPPTAPLLTSWYSPAVTLLEKIDNLHPPQRPIDKPFRLSVSDVFKGIGTGFNVAGRLGSGYVQPGERVLILPAGINVNIKNVYINDCPVPVAFAGDHANLTLSGVDMANVNIGSTLCDPANPSKNATRIRAKVVLFNLEVPMTKGFPVVFHYQSINEPAVIKRLVSQLNRSTGEVIKSKPRCLVKNSNAVVDIELERSVCLELYSEFKDLGRFMLRQGGQTIAAGLVEEIVQSKSSANGASQS